MLAMPLLTLRSLGPRRPCSHTKAGNNVPTRGITNRGKIIHANENKRVREDWLHFGEPIKVIVLSWGSYAIKYVLPPTPAPPPHSRDATPQLDSGPP